MSCNKILNALKYFVFSFIHFKSFWFWDKYNRFFSTRFSHLQALTRVSKRTWKPRWHLMTSDTSQAKSVVLIQWGLVTGSGSISRSAYLCLNHFFLTISTYQAFLKLSISVWALYFTFINEYAIERIANNWAEGGNIIIRVISINTDVLSSSLERGRDRSLASGHEHLVFTVRRCGPTTLGAIKSSQHMAVKTKLICVAHANGRLWKH